MDRWRAIGLGLLCAGIWGMQSVISRALLLGRMLLSELECLLVADIVAVCSDVRELFRATGRFSHHRAIDKYGGYPAIV